MNSKKKVSLDDIEAGLNHLSSMASELSSDLEKNAGNNALSEKAERIAYVSWMMTRLLDQVE